MKYSPCSTECFLAILIYFRRISVGNSLLYRPPNPKSSSQEENIADSGAEYTNQEARNGEGLQGGGRKDDRIVGDTTASNTPEVDSIQRQFSSTHINGSMERIISCDQPAVVIDSYNIHRLLITAALVAIKFLSDVFYTNLHVSRKFWIWKEVYSLPLLVLECNWSFLSSLSYTHVACFCCRCWRCFSY